MKILVTGGMKKLGAQIIGVFANALHPDRKELNIVDKASVDQLIKKNGQM